MKTVNFIWLCGLLIFIVLPQDLIAQNKSHTVEKGETLFSISKEYGISIEQLKQWNDLKAADLSVGQRLIIQPGEPHQSPSTGSGDDGATIHLVKNNETLFSISKKYQTSIAELKSWNNLTSNNLRVGQRLRIYPSPSVLEQKQSITSPTELQQNSYYVVKNNDSLYEIARKHGMSVEKLKELNNLSSNTIRVGQELTVHSTSNTPSVSEKSISSSQGEFQKYTIRGGSTSIAELVEKFQMDEEEFRALNNNITSSTLRNGQKVTVLAPPSKHFKNPYVKNRGSMNSLGSVAVSHYKQKVRASPTTSGELYNPQALTGAHASIALGSLIFVKNSESEHGVFVRINDRVSGDELKLSTAAWKALQLTERNTRAIIYQNK